MLPCICYSSWNCKNSNHAKALIGMGFKGWRIYVPLGMLPPQIPINSTPVQWRNYISNFVNNCPDGCWDWDNFSTNWWASCPNQRFKDCLDFCKANNWLPILNMGASDETHGWIDLAPTSDKWDWLKKFSYEFALYLRDIYRFDRVDLEPINEPNEKGRVEDWYAPLVACMGSGWKTACPGWKVHACGVDVNQQNYINACLANAEMMKIVDYISVHCLAINEWDSSLIEATYNNVKAKGKKFALLEMSPVSQSNDSPPLGHMPGRMARLVGRADIYGIVLMIRNEAIGTSNDMDDIYMYPLNNPDGLYCTSGSKKDWITKFNQANYKPYIVEAEDMEFFKGKTELKLGSRGMEVKLLQKVANKALAISLLIDGSWGPATDKAVTDLNKYYGYTINPGTVDKIRFKFYVATYPEIFDEIQVSYYFGER